MSAPARSHDAEVLFELTTTRLDGKVKQVFSGYRPEYDIRPNYSTCTHHEFDDETGAVAGKSVRARIWLLTPEVYPFTLWVGRVLKVSEGSRVVGRSTITEVTNNLLLSLDERPVDFS